MYVYICTHSVFLVKTLPHPGEDFFLCFQTLRFHISWQGLTTLRISPVLEFSQVPMHWASSGGRRLWEFPWCGLSMMLNWIQLDVLVSITIHYGNLYQPIITREFWYSLIVVVHLVVFIFLGISIHQPWLVWFSNCFFGYLLLPETQVEKTFHGFG